MELKVVISHEKRSIWGRGAAKEDSATTGIRGLQNRGRAGGQGWSSWG